MSAVKQLPREQRPCLTHSFFADLESHAPLFTLPFDYYCHDSNENNNCEIYNIDNKDNNTNANNNESNSNINNN